MDVAGFLDQATEYTTTGDVRDSLLKIVQISGQTHPLAALRAAELQRWAAGDRSTGRSWPATTRGVPRTPMLR